MKDLVKEMLVWQQQGYLDRTIWHSNLFSPSLNPQHSSASNETEQKTKHRKIASATTPTISDEECETFENEQLDPTVWVPKLCQYFNINNLERLNEVEKNQVSEFLDGIKNTTTKGALKSLLRELRYLYIPSFELKTLTDLPDIMNKRMRYLTLNTDDDGKKCSELVEQLECTVYKYHKSSKASYEFLTYLATLGLFHFNLDEFNFNDGLQEKEIEIMSITLRHNFDKLKSLKAIMDKQAFVLNITLNNPLDKSKLVPYILRRQPNNISREFTGCTGQKFDLLKLHKVVKQLITRKDNLKEKARSLSMYFNSAFPRKLSSSQVKDENLDVKESVQSLLEDLDLVEYYSQKLGHGDVIKLTEDAIKDVNKKPSSLSDLPRYFMRRLIGLNSTIREKGSVLGQTIKRKRKRNRKDQKGKKTRRLGEFEDDEISFSWDEDSTGKDTDEEAANQCAPEKEGTTNVLNSVHPLDLIYIIFLCADDFL